MQRDCIETCDRCRTTHPFKDGGTPCKRERVSQPVASDANETGPECTPQVLSRSGPVCILHVGPTLRTHMESTGNAPSMQTSGSTWFKRAPGGILQAMRGCVYWRLPQFCNQAGAAGRITRLSMGLLSTARMAVTLEVCQSPGPSYLRRLTMRPMPDASAASSTYHIQYKGTCSLCWAGASAARHQRGSCGPLRGKSRWSPQTTTSGTVALVGRFQDRHYYSYNLY